ncbi:MAG: poly-gamma-glutamate biosynthesis protein PgsC [Bacteroidales bacterium]|nr:poly-gamma-glutamate biosynthesis protein PgsC [Bacteroidales bacterium]MCF8406021.1 poly-gamma-glutamate biosynthesis protein PgsC [Bacteroidales bacterium]
MIVEIFIIGLLAGFLFYELTGISPGGVIAPAYIALYIYQPSQILITILIGVGVYYIIKFLSSRLILYGRRKFLIAILLSFFLKLMIVYIIQPMPQINLDLQSVGYIIPGLIAHDMSKQKITPTLLSLGIVSLIIFQISLLIA